MENINKNVTIEDLRDIKVFENLTEPELQEILDGVKELGLILMMISSGNRS
jgi:hypothetical protein